MRAILIGTLAIFGLVQGSFGQGEVFFANPATPLTAIYLTPIQLLPGYNGTLASSWYFALFSADNSVNAVNGAVWQDPQWSFTGAYGTNLTTAGRFAASQPNIHGAVVVPGVAAGSTAALNVLAWNASAGGSTLAQFVTAWNGGTAGLLYGQSAVGHIVLGDATGIPDNFLFGAGAGQIPGFVIVPEPTTFAMVMLCSVVVMAVRHSPRRRPWPGFNSRVV